MLIIVNTPQILPPQTTTYQGFTILYSHLSIALPK